MSDGKGDYKLVVNDQEDEAEKRHVPSSPRKTQQSSTQLSPSVRTALPILSYCFASILMTVTNKYVLSKYKFNLNFLLLSIQSIVTVSLLHAFHFLNLSQFRAYNHDEAKKWFPIAAFLVAMIYTGSKALQFLRIPIYTIFKNLTIILIAYGEVLWFGGGVTRVMLVSFILMVLSSVIAGWSDIADTLAIASTSLKSADLDLATNTLWGYLWMSLNCVSSAGFVLYMRKRIKLTNFKDFDTVYYNNLLSIPLLLVLTFIFEDWSVANLEANFPLEARSSLIWSMIFSGVSAFGISYTSAWCVRVTSSTTYSMVGALNKLPVAASGMIFFGDPVTFGSVTAIMVGFFAGLVYSHAKTEQSRLAKQGQVQNIPMSSSSQSVADGNKANSI